MWGGQNGTWQVELDVNGQVISTSNFTVTAAGGVPALRVTQGTGGGAYIPNDRTTPINFRLGPGRFRSAID